MYQDRVVLCASSAYTRNLFNEDFKTLPEPIQQELKIICVLLQRMLRVLSEYEEDGTLVLKAAADEGIIYDEIGSVLKIKEIQRTKAVINP